MNNSLKAILIKIAQLSHSNQRWILNRLTTTQKLSLKKHQGYAFLHKAACGNKSLNHSQENAPTTQQEETTGNSHETRLPAYCQQLALKEPLYVAIVIEQSEASWGLRFLERFDHDSTIKTLLENQVLDIKPVVKEAVFNEWQQSIPFEDYLEEVHG